MFSLRNACAVAWSAALFFTLSDALPAVDNNERSIVTRSIKSYTGCTTAQETKLKQDFLDAATFAKGALGLTKTDNAFTNYLREDDFAHAQEMWETVAAGAFEFSVICAPSTDKACGTTSWAITDADAQASPAMTICPKYFTDVTSKLSTTADTYVKPAKRNAKGWCKVDAKFKDFSVGGLTLLHEMTHLDAVGKLAGYPEVTDSAGVKSHGTEDVDGVTPANNPPLQARNLLKLWTAGKATKTTLEPYRNAESIAAAAFEHFIKTKCSLDSLDI